MNNINQLLDKYWEGETSLQEEQEIKAYFRSGQVAPEHEALAPMWGYMDLKAEKSYDLDLTEVLNKALSEEASSVSDDAVQPGARVISLRQWIPAVAALLVAVLAVVAIMRPSDTTEDIDKTHYASNVIVLDGNSDSEEALKVTREALAFLSGKINKGGTSVNSSIQNLDKINVIN